MRGNASVRISQILVGVVLAFMAAILYRTSTDSIARRTGEDTRSLGTRVAQRESVRIDQTIASIQSLKDSVDIKGFSPARFAAAALATMRADPMIDVVDYFDADYSHTAHIERSGVVRLGTPSPKQPVNVSSAIIDAVDLVLSESSVTRTTVSSHALRILGSSIAHAPAGHLYVYVAEPIAHRFDVVGTIVARVDIQRLIVSDLATVIPPARYVLDDGSGRLEIGTPGLLGSSETDSQSISLPFADRAWTLLLAPPVTDQSAKPWLFVLLWLAAWLAVCVPIEVVGQISRRVQTLNEGLEASVAARTRQLQASVAELRTLAAVVESVHEGVMLLGPDLRVRYANDALCRELGCELKDIEEKPVYDFAPLRLSRAQLEELREAVRSRGYAYLETERTRLDGTKYWAGVTLTRHLEEGDEEAGLIAVSRDVTDRRLLVDELVGAKEELERQMRVRADFIGTASHELRTPVTTLRTLSALLRGKVQPRYPFAEDDAKLLAMLDFETRRLASLVDDLLEVAKVDASESGLLSRDADLCAIAKSEIETTFAIDARSWPSIALDLPTYPVYVHADENALRRIVVNLVGNARKFTPADGRVRLIVERVGDRARLTVADTGIGIPEKDLPHVFERFYRVERPGTEIRGTGLGLAIVARLIERMGGVISITSEAGKGTTVSVEMRAADVRAAAGD
jgi:PAS domain S-box-containing protein